MYCYSGGAFEWAKHLANEIRLKIIIGGVVFAYEEKEEEPERPKLSLDEALNKTGFIKCEFGPDLDECESCNKPYLQHYYLRTSYYDQEGVYFCAGCAIEFSEEKSIKKPQVTPGFSILQDNKTFSY